MAKAGLGETRPQAAAGRRREPSRSEPGTSHRPAGQRRALGPGPAVPVGGPGRGSSWRHLRRPVRSGPPVELDLAATIRERARSGVATPPVVMPRRRNTMRVLLLLDRNGSMSPYHGYVDYVLAAIRDAGRVDEVSVVYFHDVPVAPDSRPRAAAVLAEDPFRRRMSTRCSA